MKNKSRKTGHFIGEVLIGLLFLFAVVGWFYGVLTELYPA